MHHVLFLQDLAIVILVAAVVTIVCRRIKQPVVLGYILAGVIVGPHTPPFPLISSPETIETLSELGVVFLMFSLGLEFSLRKLRDVGATALVAATLEILLMVSAGYQLGSWFGWSRMDSVFLGAILSISSTTIIIKALQELGRAREDFAQVIFGILIVEDILAIVMIALLSGFATTGSLEAGAVGATVLKLSAFLGVLLVAGLIAVPRLIDYVARFRSNETLLITTVGLCFGVSLLAVKLGYSVALGAFLIGAIIAEARQIGKIETLMQPIRDLFSAVFFISIGLLIDPAMLGQYLWPILIISAVVVIGKVVACTTGVFVAGNDLRSSLRVGMGLAQIGEFSFIIAALGLSLKVTSGFLYPVAVAVSVLTTLLTPYLVRGSDSVVAGFDRFAPRSLVGFLEAYTRWVGAFPTGREQSFVTNLARKWVWQIALNLLLVAAVFITAVFAQARGLRAWRADGALGVDGINAIVWGGAVVFSLPMLIAVVRKWRALAMLLAEASVSAEAGGENTATLRGVVSTTVLAVGYFALFLFILLLSSAILPSGNLLWAVAGALVISAILLRRTFIRLHSKAQVALYETFAQAPDPAHAAPAPALPPLLQGAVLKTVALGSGSSASRRAIAELKLRTRTGASIVAIERAGLPNVINPGADEELADGDRLLLLGSAAELAAAETLLRAPA